MARIILLNEVSVEWDSSGHPEIKPRYQLESRGVIAIAVDNILFAKRSRASGSVVTLLGGGIIDVAESLEDIYRLANSESQNG